MSISNWNKWKIADQSKKKEASHKHHHFHYMKYTHPSILPGKPLDSSAWENKTQIHAKNQTSSLALDLKVANQHQYPSNLSMLEK